MICTNNAPTKLQPYPALNTCAPGQEAAISSRVGNSSAQTVGAQAFRTLEFRLFEHKNAIFVRFLPSEPPFWGISSTKSPFLCSEDWESGIGNPKIGIGNTESGRSCKSPRTPLKCKVLITRQLTFEGVLDELKLCSPSTAIKYNYLCIRCLCFEGVLGDLHERRTHQVAALSSTQHLRPGQATASFGGDT